MTKYDVTDEAIINGTPDVVYNALKDEIDGKTSWWMPHLSSKLREGSSSGNVGALCDITVHGKRKVKFTTKTVEVKDNEMIRANYIEGALRGEGLWKFDSLEGKTKLSFRWQTSLSGFLPRIMGLFLPVEKKHSDVMKAGFDNLNKFIEGNN